MQRITRIVTLLLVCSMTIFMACEGPSGSEGPQGPEGPKGPVGPAGEDGSMMYSGNGAPDGSTGENGDYYLNTDTGEMYGPKDDSGWGNPIIVLKGEDGEDGSQIHAGSGVPDASLGDLGDFYLDQANYDMYGPKTENGWGSPINLKGADGNANVSRYIFPSNSFSSTHNDTTLTFSEVDSTEMRNSSWEVYLVRESSSYRVTYDHIPGVTQFDDTFSVRHKWNGRTSEMYINIYLKNGIGHGYGIEVVQIGVSNTNDQTSKAVDSGPIIPDHLDVTNYREFAEYYNFGNVEHLRVR